jgi:hypothetical protein
MAKDFLVLLVTYTLVNVSMSLLDDLIRSLILMNQAFPHLVKHLDENTAFKLLGNPNSTKTDYSMWIHRKMIEDALHYINIPKEEINQEAVESIYINLANLSISLKELETTLKEFISSGEKERNLTEFLKQSLTKLVGLKNKK